MMKNINELKTVDELFNVVKFNDYAKSLSLAVYNEFRKGWNKIIIENEKKMLLFMNEMNTSKLVRGVLRGVPNQTINNIIEIECLKNEHELAMKMVTMFFLGDSMFFDFRYEDGYFIYENPIYTEMDGYNYINATFEDLMGWKESWLEYLSLYDVSKEEYPIEEYAKDSGYIPIEEYRKEFLYY